MVARFGIWFCVVAGLWSCGEPGAAGQLKSSHALVLDAGACRAQQGEGCHDRRCDAGLYCVEYSVYDHPRCRSLGELVKDPIGSGLHGAPSTLSSGSLLAPDAIDDSLTQVNATCFGSDGSIDFQFSAEGLVAPDNTVAVLAEFGRGHLWHLDEFVPLSLVAWSEVHDGAIEEMLCNNALDPRDDYPGVAIWLDMNQDGICNADTDIIKMERTHHYAWVSHMSPLALTYPLDFDEALGIGCEHFNEALVDWASTRGEIGSTCEPSPEHTGDVCEATGSFSATVSFSGFSDLPNASVYVAAVPESFNPEPESVFLGDTQINPDGFSLQSCDALSVSTNYPAIDVFIDWDGDGLCDPQVDYVGRTTYYAWMGDVFLDIRPDNPQQEAGSCESFH